jgi:CHAD domain-containing protein
LIAALESRRYAELLSCYRDFLNSADETPHAALNVASFAKDFIPERIRLIRKAGRHIDHGSKAKDLHRLRVRVKRLRYQLELLAEPYGQPLRKASKHLRQLQNTLGDHQDACVAQSVLDEYRRQLGKKSDKRCFGCLIKLEASRAATLRKRFYRDWAKFDDDAGSLKRIF